MEGSVSAVGLWVVVRMVPGFVFLGWPVETLTFLEKWPRLLVSDYRVNVAEALLRPSSSMLDFAEGKLLEMTQKPTTRKSVRIEPTAQEILLTAYFPSPSPRYPDSPKRHNLPYYHGSTS